MKLANLVAVAIFSCIAYAVANDIDLNSLVA